MTVHVFASLQPKPEHRSQVEHALKALVSATRAEPGNISYDLFVAGESDHVYFCLMERYRDKAAFEAHKTTQHYLDYREKAANWLLEPPRVEFLLPLDVLGDEQSCGLV